MIPRVRPVGPGRAEWIAHLTPARRALIESSDEALAMLAGPCRVDEHAEALSTVRTALAFAEAWAERGQRALDVERQRGAALLAAVRAVVDAPAVGCTVPGVQGVLRVAALAYEGRGE